MAGRRKAEERARVPAGGDARDADQIPLLHRHGGGHREGVIGASLDVDGSKYFNIHHTAADTFDKIDPRELAHCVAAMAVVAYTVADLPEPLAGAIIGSK